jgi:LacI family transcriptional regulator
MPDHAKPRITINTVAKAAGVSATTVSLVLNNDNPPNIPPETCLRVLNAVKELGYRPNASARHMRTARSGLIGFVTDIVASTPFAGNMITGAQHVAWENGKVLLIVNSNKDPKLEEAAVEVMLERQVEGIVYATMYHRLVEPPQAIREVPTVLLDCFVMDGSLPSVVPDEFGGGYTAVDMLIEKGHRRIGFINLNENIPAGVERRRAYHTALQDHGLPEDKELIKIGGGEAEGGYFQTRQLLQLPEPPSAIFCTTDRMAMGAYDAIKEMGLRIPEDIAVIGFDNQEIIAEHLRPPLTTIQLPHYEMGSWVVEHLLTGRLSPESSIPIHHRIPCQLVRRASV